MRSPLLSLLARLILGGTFVWMGWSKVSAPVEFLKLVRQYEMVPADLPWLLNSIAVLLPWIEIVCGLLLVFGLLRRGAALVGLVMLLVFTAAVARRGLALAEASDLAFCLVEFDCGCGSGVVNVCRKLGENALLMLLTLLLLLAKPAGASKPG